MFFTTSVQGHEPARGSADDPFHRLLVRAQERRIPMLDGGCAPLHQAPLRCGGLHFQRSACRRHLAETPQSGHQARL